MADEAAKPQFSIKINFGFPQMVVPFFDTSTFYKTIGFGGYDFGKTHKNVSNLSMRLHRKTYPTS